MWTSIHTYFTTKQSEYCFTICLLFLHPKGFIIMMRPKLKTIIKAVKHCMHLPSIKNTPQELIYAMQITTFFLKFCMSRFLCVSDFSPHLWPSCPQSSQHHPSSSSVVLLSQGPVVLMGPGTFQPLEPLCGHGRTGSS